MFFFRMALPFTLYALLYAATLAENLTTAHDSAAYLLRIASGHPVFHPHHLLYEPLAVLWLAAWQSLGLVGDPAAAVAALNVLFGGLILQMFFLLLLRRGGLPYGAALLGTALPGFSFGLWFYAGAVEVYVIPLFLLTWAFYLLTAPTMAGRTWAAAGAIHGLAVLFHQVHLLFGFVPIARLLLDRGIPGAVRWVLLLRYVGAAALVVLPAYALVLLLEVRATSIEAAWLWFTNYAHKEAYWHGPDLATAAKAAVGLGRSVIGGHFLFAIPELRSVLTSAFSDNALSDEVFLVRDLSPVGARLLALAAAAFVLLVLALAASSLPNLASRWREHRLLLALTAAWLLPYAAFFLFWEPYNVEFWLPQALCLWLVLLLCLWPSGRGRLTAREHLSPAAGIAALAVLLFAINYAGSLRFTSTRSNDYTYWCIEPLIAAARPGDLVIVGDGWIVESYLKLFVDARPLALAHVYERRGNAALEETMAAVAGTLDHGGRVFVAEDALRGATAGSPFAPGYAAFVEAFRNRIAPTSYYGAAGRRLAVIER